MTLPFPRMTYYEAMGRYGSDKPDTRFGMELKDVSEIVKDRISKYSLVLLQTAAKLKRSVVKDGNADYSRKDIDGLAEFAAIYGAKGLAWLKVEEDGVKRTDR